MKQKFLHLGQTDEDPDPVFPDFSFDGFGINGADQYRSRLATLTPAGQAAKVGPLFGAAPDLHDALSALLCAVNSLPMAVRKGADMAEAMDQADKALYRARGNT